VEKGWAPAGRTRKNKPRNLGGRNSVLISYRERDRRNKTFLKRKKKGRRERRAPTWEKGRGRNLSHNTRRMKSFFRKGGDWVAQRKGKKENLERGVSSAKRREEERSLTRNSS